MSGGHLGLDVDGLLVVFQVNLIAAVQLRGSERTLYLPKSSMESLAMRAGMASVVDLKLGRPRFSASACQASE